jgi:hypothetical protein
MLHVHKRFEWSETLINVRKSYERKNITDQLIMNRSILFFHQVIRQWKFLQVLGADYLKT